MKHEVWPPGGVGWKPRASKGGTACLAFVHVHRIE